jgi:hypothetical protein
MFQKIHQRILKTMQMHFPLLRFKIQPVNFFFYTKLLHNTTSMHPQDFELKKWLVAGEIWQESSISI